VAQASVTPDLEVAIDLPEALILAPIFIGTLTA
jgi:hypothetical protein